MSYTTRDRLIAKIPDEFLAEALDDDGDGSEEAGLLDEIISAAEEEVDSYLEGRYTLPLVTVPKLLKTAATTFACETLYERRGYSTDTDHKNPWSDRASRLRKRLAGIASGAESLQVATEKAEASVDAITEPARTHSSSGRLLA